MRRLMRQLEDRPAATSLASRLITAGGALLALPLVTTQLSADEQGYHYTFFALLGAQVFVELGLSIVLLQAVAHETAKLTVSHAPRLSLSGEPQILLRLSAILRFAMRWYAWSGLLVGALLAAGGSWFFASMPIQANGAVGWAGPWALLCVAALLSVWGVGALCLLEGFGAVGAAAVLRLLSGIVGSGTLITGLALGCGLWATALQAFCAQALICFMGLAALRPWLRAGVLPRAPSSFAWRTEILPLQWRIAASFISGWLIFQLMTPTILRSSGAEQAGRFGLGVQLANGILSLSDVFANVRYPAWGAMVVRRDWAALDQDFARTSRRSMLVVTLLGGVLVAIIWLVPQVFGLLGNRLPDVEIAIFLAIAAVANQWAFNLARYLRAHRQDPFMGVSLAFALVMALGCVWEPTRSAHNLSLLFMSASLLILAGMGTVVWSHCRRAWHR